MSALPAISMALLIGACGSPQRPAAAPTSAAATFTPTPSSAAPTPTPTPPELTAKDGSNVKACRKGDCEIHVRGTVRVPLDRKFGMPSFIVIHKPPNEVRFQISRPASGDVEAYVAGTGYIALANGIKVTVKMIDGSGAVLRFQRKTVDPRNDLSEGSEGTGIYTTS
ncbi:hypothetical protein [Nonomuraea typhae]|uniref:Lipoprotein n=1 Tax=Nonomuraea typhae TaxID=2603600 RepID=A0ABW7ZCN6_9ACTN